MAGGTNLFTQLTSTLWVALTQAEGSVGSDQLALFAKCTGTPPTTAGIFAHGCLITQTDSASGQEAVWQNTGTSAVPAWGLIPTGGAGGTTYGMVAKTTTGLTDTLIFETTAPSAMTITGVWTIGQEFSATPTSATLLGAGGTIATMATGSVGAMVGSSIANVSVAAGDSVRIRSSSATVNAKVLVSFLA